jgi:drug/metabolite transporter (DMT)-like permease
LIYLILVSIAWGFSFGLIKGQLTSVDSNFVSFVRILLSFMVFIPFIRLRGLNRKSTLQLIMTGMVQYGIMYITYITAFRFLQSYEVALFTIFTPLYVTLINNALQKQANRMNILTTLLAVVGTAVIVLRGLPQGGLALGFILVQGSNLCFAFGQVYYKQIMSRSPGHKDQEIFALLYLGGAAITALSAGIFTNWSALVLGRNQIFTLLYLGIIASGVCFFFWNFGGRKVDTGTLAIFNNLKVPIAVTISLLFFGEKVSILHLAIGGSIVISALFLNEYGNRQRVIKPTKL